MLNAPNRFYSSPSMIVFALPHASFQRTLRCVACLFLSLLALPTLSGCQPSVSDKDLTPIGVLEARKLWSDAKATPKASLFLDPRPKSSFDAAHIPGARHVNIDTAAQRTAAFERAAKQPFWERAVLTASDAELSQFDALVIYADNPGSASARVLAKLLIRQKFRNVYLLEGGLDAWRARGGEVEGSLPQR